MRNYARKRRTNKPQALVEFAGKLHVQGKSNREIGRALKVHHDTVPSMLAESEIVKRYRAGLLERVPQMLESFDLLIKPNPGLSVEELGRNVRWGLEHTGVAVKRETSDGDIILEHAGLTDEELDERERDLRRRRAQLRLEIRRRTQGEGS